MKTPRILFAALLTVAVSSGAQAAPEPKPALNPVQKQALQQQGISHSDRLNAEAMSLVQRGLADGSAKRIAIQDATGLRLQLPQMKGDLDLYQQLYDSPAKAAEDKDIAAKYKRLERFISAPAIAELKARVENPPTKEDRAKQAAKEEEDKANKVDAIVKSENAAAAMQAGLRTAAPPPMKKTAAQAPSKDEAWWESYYCKYYLMPKYGTCNIGK
ncbi:MAG: hypothetical protein ABIJ96_16340 [Elusimicrobiota bacterium]